MSDADDPTDLVRSHLAGIELRQVTFQHVSATRREDEPAASPAEVGVVTTSVDFQTIEGPAAAFRISMDVDRRDISAHIVAVAVLSMPPDSELNDFAVLQVIAERIAVPALYPYVRAKLHEVTIDMGTPPLMVGLIKPGSITLTPMPAEIAAET